VAAVGGRTGAGCQRSNVALAKLRKSGISSAMKGIAAELQLRPRTGSSSCAPLFASTSCGPTSSSKTP
jgi:hypothetical protein